MNTFFSTALATLCLAALPLAAQQGSQAKDRLGLSKIAVGEHSGLPGMWTCIVAGADKAMTVVKLSEITSVSKQSYLLEGSQRILEVTIDTTGNNSIRFYCMGGARASRVKARATNSRDLADKYMEGASGLPAKKYPEATHSHNIEYQLDSEEELNRIYESAVYSWVKNSPQTLCIEK